MRRRVPALIASVIVAAILLACVSDGSEQVVRERARVTGAGVVPADRLGIAAGVIVARADEAEMNRDLDGYKALGARWLRTAVKWSDVQPASPAQFDWTDADRLVDGAVQRGLQLLLIVNGTPKWARPSDAPENADVAPARPSDYADFLRAAVMRYKERGVRHWELGNEPNHQPSPDAAEYAQLLRAAYPAIKAADPTAVVLTGGLGGTQDKADRIAGDTFLQQLYDHGAKGYFDAVSYHPYTYPGLASERARGWSRMLNARRIMERNGDGEKKIWATEFGAPTSGPRRRVVVSEERQAEMVRDAYATFVGYAWSGPLFWFTYRDKGTEADSQKNFFGLVRRDYSPKPAFDAYRELSEAA